MRERHPETIERWTARRNIARIKRGRLPDVTLALLVALSLSTIGCGTDSATDNTPDAASDMGASSQTDSGMNSGADTGATSGTDAATDAEEDVITDAEADATVDSGADAAPDTTTDAEADVISDAEADTASDAEADAADAEADAAPDTTTDAEADVISDAEADTASDAEADSAADTDPPVTINPDLNGDGTLNVLVIGTSRSIQSGGEAFAPGQIAAELQSILSADPSISVQVNVVAEDIYQTEQVLLGLGQGGDEYTWNYSSHSLTQYYYWPSGIDARMDNLAGQGDGDWDHVVIGADPYIVAKTPGYYALGVNKIAAKVAEGEAQPLLLMTWLRDNASTAHFAEHTYRTADGARVSLPTIPAGLAWEALPAAMQDSANVHPTPNGAYLAAASVYAYLYGRSAATSDYSYDDAIADIAHDTLLNASDAVHYTGQRTFVSPFKGADIPDRVLNYNHTGTSSERGILAGLRWVLGIARVELQYGGDAPIDFNYGRANTNFEEDKRYEINPEQFDFSLGFPMQDNGNHGNTSMLYGLDRRLSDVENGTDLGTALYMVRRGELPYGRAIPIRTLYAQLKEATPTQSAYRDNWHMHRDLDKAAAAFMYTLLTGHCALDDEPADTDSDAWRQWMAHKTGYETAWTLMHLSGAAPCFKVLPDSVGSTSVTPTQSAGLSIAFMNPPTSEVTVTLSTNNDSVVTYTPNTLVFTPENHDVPQMVTMTGAAGQPGEDVFVITASAASADPTFDGLVDRWEYRAIRE